MPPGTVAVVLSGLPSVTGPRQLRPNEELAKPLTPLLRPVLLMRAAQTVFPVLVRALP